MIVAAGGLIGGLFFLWIAGLRIIAPTSYAWVMQSDWRIHFLGWHFFRSEPWLWPPGRIAGYYHAPDGTAIGFTDSVPLMAFLFKPFSTLLPDVFQYLGLWLLACYVLQGMFGVLLARLWTDHRGLHLLAAAFFVLMPTLLIRVGHPSLCAHFLLLWTLWLYFRTKPEDGRELGTHAALGLIAGLTHPYLAVMVLALLTAVAWRRRAFAGLFTALFAVIAAWWAAGLFTSSGPEALAAEGLGNYSMNLLSPVTPSGWSTLLPPLAVASSGQLYEGFQYLGLGTLALIGVAIVVLVASGSPLRWQMMAPIALIAMICAVYALSPRITFGDRVLADLSAPLLERLAIFRATGRFFWPMAYLLLATSLAVILARLSVRGAAVVLTAALAIQVVDLRAAHAERRVTSRSEAFHANQSPLTSSAWASLLPRYRHLVLINPPHCGDAPASFEWPAFLAGRFGMTVNAGEVARANPVEAQAYCESLHGAMRGGDVRDDTVYVIHPRFVDPMRASARVPVDCEVIDRLTVCVTARSRQAASPVGQR